MNKTLSKAPSLPVTQNMLRDLFSVQVRSLYLLINHFGGASLAERLDQTLVDAAGRYRWNLVSNEGAIRNFKKNLRWGIYHRVMSDVIRYAVSVAGYRLVEERIKETTRILEKRRRRSYFEIAFRLGLHRMSRGG